MPAYRFCRTDDIALLTEAVNACYLVHFPEQDPLSPEDFKREIRELNVWCSSCMVASSEGDPIGVVTGAKRERETLVHRIGVHPEFQRRGHARHLLESLGQKLSVLGPPRVVAELPEDEPAVRDLFEALDYREEARFADFALQRPGTPVRATGAVERVSLDDVLRAGAFDPAVPRSWERALTTLQNRKEQVQGLAIASDRRVEAYVLFRDLPAHGRREIVALGGGALQGERGDAEGAVLLEIAIRVACQAGSLAVTVPRVSSEEVSWAHLESIGFQKGRTYLRVAGGSEPS
jgi:hypothetical protein